MEQCSICLEALDGGVVALAACGHRFHAACLAQMAGAVGTATTRRERALAARRVVPEAPAMRGARRETGKPHGQKPVEMRRVGDVEWRWFESQKDAAKAFGISPGKVSNLVTPISPAVALRETFEARPAPPRKREWPTKGKTDRAPPKKPYFRGKRVEGAISKANGKWRSEIFPGREFDDLDSYRAAKKQRAAQRAEWRAHGK